MRQRARGIRRAADKRKDIRRRRKRPVLLQRLQRQGRKQRHLSEILRGNRIHTEMDGVRKAGKLESQAIERDRDIHMIIVNRLQKYTFTMLKSEIKIEFY